jgi:hypothetical protein
MQITLTNSSKEYSHFSSHRISVNTISIFLAIQAADVDFVNMHILKFLNDNRWTAKNLYFKITFCQRIALFCQSVFEWDLSWKGCLMLYLHYIWLICSNFPRFSLATRTFF